MATPKPRKSSPTPNPAGKNAKPNGKASPQLADPSDDDAPFETPGAQAAYEKYLPLATAHEGNIVPMRADTLLAYQNVKAGVDAIAPHEKRLHEELPKLDVDALLALPTLALAVGFADSQVSLAGGPSGVKDTIAEALELRALLLTSAEALARAGIFPLATVKKIKEGRGYIDAAQDCVDLAALFQKNAAAVKGKSPVTAAHVKKAASTGSELLTLLRPKGARKKKDNATATATDIRDRIWTLLVEGHRDLRRAGYWLWEDDFGNHVPLLQSREAPPRKKKTAPAPVAAPAAPSAEAG